MKEKTALQSQNLDKQRFNRSGEAIVFDGFAVLS